MKYKKHGQQENEKWKYTKTIHLFCHGKKWRPIQPLTIAKYMKNFSGT